MRTVRWVFSCAEGPEGGGNDRKQWQKAVIIPTAYILALCSHSGRDSPRATLRRARTRLDPLASWITYPRLFAMARDGMLSRVEAGKYVAQASPSRPVTKLTRKVGEKSRCLLDL